MPADKAADRLLQLPDIAERTGIPINTLRWMRHRGEGPLTFRLGRRVVAKESDVDAWIEAKAASAVGDRLVS